MSLNSDDQQFHQYQQNAQSIYDNKSLKTKKDHSICQWKSGFSLNIFYLLKYAKRIRHKLNKLMKSSPTYNKLQHYLIEHACI